MKSSAISLPWRARENPPDVIITEIGGTVGDIESLPFLEAVRQMRAEAGQRKLPLSPCDAGAIPQRGTAS